MEGNTLQHYGVKGMKWGQHIFTKEEKKTTKILKRHLAADKRHLRNMGEIHSESAGEYRTAEANFQKELRRPSLSRSKKQARIEDSSKILSNVGKKYEKAQGDMLRADRIYDSDAKQYMNHIDGLVKKYGQENVNSIKTKEYRLGEEYTKELIKTGITLYDLPLIGTYLSGKYIGNREAEDRRASIDEAANKRY